MARAGKKRGTSSSVAALRGGKGRAPSSSSSSSSSASSPTPAPAKASPARSGSWWEAVKSILGAVLIFLVIRTFFVEAFRIPSSSMVPTLLVGDWLFVNKLRYGPHIPFTRINLPGYAEPKRGEVVIFESPVQYETRPSPKDSTPTLVKRIVAVAGDTIFMRDDALFINGIAQRPGFQSTPDGLTAADGTDGYQQVLERFMNRSALPGTRFDQTAPRRGTVPTRDSWGPILVPQGHFFMLGDNRDNSVDSRYYGFVPRENVRGRPMFVYYSYDADRGLDYFRAFTEIRWGRIGHWIE